MHNISTDKGSSGGPLILSKNLNVVGIHRGHLNNKLNKAIFIKNILDDINQKLSKKNNYSTYRKISIWRRKLWWIFNKTI